MSGLSTRSLLLSLYAPGWRSNRLCVIKWWWWLYLTFVKGGAPDFFVGLYYQPLSSELILRRIETEWKCCSSGVILRWTEGMCLQRLVCLLCVPPLFTHVCAHALPCYRYVTYLTCEVEIPRGQLYLRGDPRRYTDTRSTLRLPLHYLKPPAWEQKRDRQQRDATS